MAKRRNERAVAVLLKRIPGVDEALTASMKGNAAENKRLLLEMAKRGDARPTGALSSRFKSYTSKNSGCYDAAFDAAIRKASPFWFNADRVKLKKSQLLSMAQRGKSRPPISSGSLGVALFSYTRPHTSVYDAVFDAKIRKLAPHWFRDETSKDVKAELLAMATGKHTRPASRTSLGSKMCNYMSPASKCYDVEFTTAIRTAAPNWFRDLRVIYYKTTLLTMARGESRPSHRESLGEKLRTYCSSCAVTYDPAFDKAIRAAAPHWFRKKL